MPSEPALLTRIEYNKKIREKKMDEDKIPFHVDLLSDGTGETALAVLKAVLIQYDHEKIPILRHKNIRTREQIENIFKKIESRKENSLLVYTVVLADIRKFIGDMCKEYKIKGIDLLGKLIQVFDSQLESRKKEPGILRSVNEDYFNRIEAMEFSLKHDDGQLAEDLEQADIILVGVSRASKTPLSLFLSYKGWKVANVPIVYNIPPPESLFKVDNRKIIALTIDPDCLFKIRKNRLEKFGYNPGGSYADRQKVYLEVSETLGLFQKYKWPVLNVTDRALEETANEIERIISTRKNIPEKIM